MSGDENRILLVIGRKATPARTMTFVPVLKELGFRPRVFCEQSVFTAVTAEVSLERAAERTLTHHLAVFGHQYYAIIFSDLEVFGRACSAVMYCPQALLIVDSEGRLAAPAYPWAESAAGLRGKELSGRRCDALLFSSPGELDSWSNSGAALPYAAWVPTNLYPFFSTLGNRPARRPKAGPPYRVSLVGDFRESAETEALYQFLDAMLPRLRDLPIEVWVYGLGIPPLHTQSYTVYTMPCAIHSRGIWRDSDCLLVCEQRHSRQKIEVLYAFRSGVPVVLNSYAADHFAVHHEDEVLIANTPERVTGEVRRVLSDPRLAERLLTNAATYCHRYHRHGAVVSAFESVFAALSGRPCIRRSPLETDASGRIIA